MAIMTVVGEYELIRKIGEGGYGKIFIARRVSGNGPSSEVVLKQVKLPTRKQDREMCLREVSIMTVSYTHLTLPTTPYV